MLSPESETYLAFLRYDLENKQACIVALNFSNEWQMLRLSQNEQPAGLLFSSEPHDEAFIDLKRFILAPFEVVIIDANPMDD